MSENGWNRCESGKEDINDEEVQALFRMIDKDKSGSLSMRVKLLSTSNVKIKFISGGKKSM